MKDDDALDLHHERLARVQINSRSPRKDVKGGVVAEGDP
jgi:hypothetical protein